MLRKILVILVMLGFLGTVVGCHTVHGLGQDIERLGEKTKKAAE